MTFLLDLLLLVLHCISSRWKIRHGCYIADTSTAGRTLGDAWQPIQRYWCEPTLENRKAIRTGLTAEGMRNEYSVGIPDPTLIKPEGYTLDAALLARPGNADIQLDLFLDYANNVKMYPKFHEYFRTAKPPLLAVWGQFDPYFIPAGASISWQRDRLPLRGRDRNGERDGAILKRIAVGCHL